MLIMAARTGTAHVVTTKRRYKDQVYCTHLLRRSYREDGKVKNETLGNLSHLPDSVIELIRRSLAGETFVATVFQVNDPTLLDKVKAGDKVRFTAAQIKGAFVVMSIEKIAP